MKSELVRLFLPVGAGVLLGLFFAFRGFFRARAGAPDAPGFVQLLAGLTGAPAILAMIGGMIALQMTN